MNNNEMNRHARVFISCGQTKNSSELETAHKIGDRLKDLSFEPYIAVEEQTLAGLKENIFYRLKEATEYFVFVDFKREQLVRSAKNRRSPGLQHRGSLFSHQELALASFLDLPLLAFQEKGVKEDDGILRFLQANAIPFTDRHLLPNVIADEVRKRGWTAHSRNELVLEREPGQYVDARVAGTQIVRRFYYVAVRNLHHEKIARNCYVYLEKAIKVDESSAEIPFGSVELKWAGYTLPNAHILPQTARPFDALFTYHTEPTNVGFNVFSDSSLFGHPHIGAAGLYELQYRVVCDNFPAIRGSFTLNLADTLSDTTLK